MNGMQCEGIGTHALRIEIVDELLLTRLTACQELHGAIAMRTHTLATIDQRQYFGVVQHLMKFGGMQGWRDGDDILVKLFLSLSHQLPQRLCITLCHIANGTFYNLLVPLAQRFMKVLFSLGGGKGVRLVQV